MAQLATMSLAERETPAASIPPKTMEPVSQLTRGMVKGNEDAYQEFFDAYARRLLVYQLALTNGQEDAARELLQQTMIRVAKYIKPFEDEEIFWSWLRNLARSCWIDEHRKRSRYWSFLEVFRKARSSESPISLAEEPETKLAALLAGLDASERELLEEKYIEGRSVKEIASASGTSEKAVESKLSRLREKLRRMRSA